MPTNTATKFAVHRLLRQYVRGVHNGRVQDCPLCNQFHTGTSFRETDCHECPNRAFERNFKSGEPYLELPCVVRGYRFRHLDMDEDDNQVYLILFWKEVEKIMPTGRKTFVLTEELRESILKIARKINRKKLCVR